MLKRISAERLVTADAYKFVLILCLFLLLIACDDDVTTSRRNPFIDKWNISFSGSFQGTGSITIKDDGTFLQDITLNPGGTVTISGDVTSQGLIIQGQMLQSGAQIGLMQGKFSGNAGNGTWQAFTTNTGTWTSTRVV